MARSSSFAGGFTEATFRDAWLAGLYEGEGSCSFSSDRIQLQIKMTDEDVIRRAQEVAGVGKVYGPYQRGPDHYKPCWAFLVYAEADVLELIERLRPWLCARRTAQVDAAIQGWTQYRESLRNDLDRFLERVDAVDGHLLWRGFINEMGYGQVTMGGPRSDPTKGRAERSQNKPQVDYVHRVAWRIARRHLPPNVNLRNTCGVLHCVAPAHWERADVVCPRGHVVDGDNVYRSRNGRYEKRSCRVCALERNRRKKEQARGQKLSV